MLVPASATGVDPESGFAVVGEESLLDDEHAKSTSGRSAIKRRIGAFYRNSRLSQSTRWLKTQAVVQRPISGT